VPWLLAVAPAFRGQPDFRKQLREGNIQGGGNPPDVDERWIAFATLNAAEIRPMNTSPMGEFFLRPPSRRPQVAHASAEGRPEIVH
jgi:hypothetical protein